MQIADQLSQLNALSPLDGRYASRGDALRGLLSEAGFMAHRVEVEVAWLVALSDAGPVSYTHLTLPTTPYV